MSKSDRSVFAPLGASNHTKEERQPEDLYVTDPKAVEALLAVEDFDRRIWEPCVGLGHISGVLEKHGHEVRKSDIIDRIGNEELDFLSCVEEWDGDIITNPPYKCFDSETECLTRTGWKRYENLNISDEILSCNIDTLELEWSGIDDIIVKDVVDEEMFHFKHRFLDIMVTKGHRMFAYSNVNGKPDKRDIGAVFAENIKSIHYLPLFGYSFNGKSDDYFVLPGCYVSNGRRDIWHDDIKIKMTDWARFLGLYIADGSYRATKNIQGNHRYTIMVKQSSKGLSRAYEIMCRLPFNVKQRPLKGRNVSNLAINSKQLWLYLSKFGKSEEKYIPDYILNGVKEVRDAFFDGYTFGDSTLCKQKEGYGLVLSTVSKRLSECLQELLLKSGSLVSVRSNKIKSGKTLYGMTYSPETKLTGCKTHYNNINTPVLKEKYSGKVWCVTLKKNGFLVIRRKGKVGICGNCAQRFVEKALDCVEEGHKVAMLLKLTFLEGLERRKLFERTPPSRIWVFSKRVSCAKNGDFARYGNGAVCYAWFVFEKGFCGRPEIRWI